MSCDCDAEMPSAFRQWRPRARKRHRCLECHGFIETGETYQKSSGVWNGQGCSFTTCEQCHALRNDVRKLTGCCYIFGDLWQSIVQLESPRSDHHESAKTLVAHFTDIRIRRGAAICPVFHAEENELPSPFPL